MPELPEVEVTRLSFADRIKGARVLALRLGKPLRWPLGMGLEGELAQGQKKALAALLGATVQGVRRRGKYLLLDTLHDASAGVLIIHLGMSGSLRFAASMGEPGPHDHFRLLTDQGELRLHDPRRFGAAVFTRNEREGFAHKLLGHLGVEPMSDDFTAPLLYAALRQRRAPIKQVLLAGEIVVGVGNIYASEALFLAGIRPTLAACQISKGRAEKLHAAIRSVLQAALDSGGSTLRNFSSASGEPGHFQMQARVYGRKDQPCMVCQRPIKMIRQGQRSSFYCLACQK